MNYRLLAERYSQATNEGSIPITRSNDAIMQERFRGTLVTWKQDKGYGFVRPSAGGKDVFVHLRDIGNIGRTPKVGDVLWFQPLADGKGRYRAAAVQVEGTAAQPMPKMKRRASRPPAAHSDKQLRAGVSLWIALGFVAAVVGLAASTPLPFIVPVFYVAASLAAFLLYAFDKAAAMNARWRTRESVLLFAGLICGWPGALVAQSLFRHKLSKESFQVSFWITVIVNIAVLTWATTESGATAIRRLLY